MDYYAHKSPDGRLQSVDDHLNGTARLCASFASAFHAEEFGRLVGQAHDIGKYSEAFQKRLNGGAKVDHSTAGALECAKLDRTICSMCVAGHHSGLPDLGNSADPIGSPTLWGRLKQALSQRSLSLSGWNGSLPVTAPEPDMGNKQFALSLWGRMLYSSLVDADFLDTEAFMNNKSVRHANYDSIQGLCDRLDHYVSQWSNPTSSINVLRNEVLNDCLAAASEKPGVFSLTVPTGGGKTISSLAFALNHAVSNGLSRVIYVIPYTSIIEQNAAVFRSILGEDNVLEHHSEAEPIVSDDEENNLLLATENWDIPVVVTTAVQFFESLYANKSSKCRKLHNIVNSVIIFDEAQMIPACHLKPCLAAIGTLVQHFGVSALLCTATQPFVSDLLADYAPDYSIREICSNTDKLFKQLKRTNYKIIGKQTVPGLAEKLSNFHQVLCIVNSRKSAKELFELLPIENSYHLSTLMTPEHRRRVLEKIRFCLANDLPCRVVSTSLIEAGVDIDFPAVFREINGLDSIVQAAGRCNREGKREASVSTVSIFELEGKSPPPILKINIGAANEALGKNSDPGERETITAYFQAYRSFLREIDKSKAVKYLSEGVAGCRLPYKTVAESFHMIDQETKPVFIPGEFNKQSIDFLKSINANRENYREIGKHSVNIYESHFNSLIESGDIEETPSGFAILKNTSLYNEMTGLSLFAEMGKAEFV